MRKSWRAKLSTLPFVPAKNKCVFNCFLFGLNSWVTCASELLPHWFKLDIPSHFYEDERINTAHNCCQPWIIDFTRKVFVINVSCLFASCFVLKCISKTQILFSWMFCFCFKLGWLICKVLYHTDYSSQETNFIDGSRHNHVFCL